MSVHQTLRQTHKQREQEALGKESQPGPRPLRGTAQGRVPQMACAEAAGSARESSGLRKRSEEEASCEGQGPAGMSQVVWSSSEWGNFPWSARPSG